MYINCFSNGLSAFFTKGPTIDTIVRSSIISDPPFRGVPLRRQSSKRDGKFSLMFYVIDLHFGTGIIDVSLTHFVSKRPIIHGGR